MEFHYLQEQILKRLIKENGFISCGRLRLREIENDLFNYHLERLVKLGLVLKNDNGYKLSLKGMQLTEEKYPIGVIRHKADTFKLYSHGIVIRKDSKDLQILNRIRTKNPFYGDKGLIGASVRKGESSKKALQLRLKSQAGILVPLKQMKNVGTLRKINYVESGELFLDFIFNFYVCYGYEGDVDFSLDNNNVLWQTIDQAIENELSSSTPIDYLELLLRKLKEDKTLSNFVPIYTEEIKTIKLA